MRIQCTCCGKKKQSGQFWTLNNYFGLSGRFCSECYEKVSHDAYKQPRHPEQYTMISIKQTALAKLTDKEKEVLGLTK